MSYEIIDCIDAGTEYCPCHLAETGDCILCSELCSKTFCDCINWKGTCIYQEYIWNGNKAKEGRKHYLCKVIDKEEIEGDVVIFTLKIPYDLLQSLVHPGSFVFLRNPKCEKIFNVPISVMNLNWDESTLDLAIDIKGVKTKKLNEVNINDNIMVKGPYWNGVLGLRHILNTKGGNCIVLARGIGMAPIMPVIKKLSSNGNKITVIIDRGNFKDNFIKKYLDLYNNVDIIECNTLVEGELTEDIKKVLLSIMKEKNIDLIHCAGADILIYRILNFIKDDIKYSCCNNAKMCCGEGVCGGCTLKFDGDVVKRMCKLQVDPKYIFKGRRLI